MPSQDPSFETIIRNLRAGKNREANARLLFDRFYRAVCGYFQRKGVSAEDSEDLAQEVFYQVFKSLHTLREEAQFAPWLFKIAENVFNNEIGRRSAQKRSAAATVSTSGDEGSDILDRIAHPIRYLTCSGIS